jgi:hypothetical protein
MRPTLRPFSFAYTSSRRIALIIMLAVLSLNATAVTAQTTAFSYQRNLVVLGLGGTVTQDSRVRQPWTERCNPLGCYAVRQAGPALLRQSAFLAPAFSNMTS